MAPPSRKRSAPTPANNNPQNTNFGICLAEPDHQITLQLSLLFKCIEQAMLSAQAANTNHICELEKHLASIATKLQKLRQQLTNAPHNKPHGKPADNATPAAPPATPHVTTPATPCPQKPLDIWGNPTENLTWAECLNASVSQQQDKPFTAITRKNKKPAPVTILPKALPHIEREVLLTCNARIGDAE
jgi:hypothetical protein